MKNKLEVPRIYILGAVFIKNFLRKAKIKFEREKNKNSKKYFKLH